MQRLIIIHNSRDSTVIEAQEKPLKKEYNPSKQIKKARGQPKKKEKEAIKRTNTDRKTVRNVIGEDARESP